MAKEFDFKFDGICEITITLGFKDGYLPKPFDS